MPRVLLVDYYARRGDLHSARGKLAEAREKYYQAGERPIETPFLLEGEAHLAVFEQRWDEAWSSFEACIKKFNEMEMRWWGVHVLRKWALAHTRRERPEDRARARELFQQVLAEFEDMGAPLYAAQMGEQLKLLTDP